jgi:Co/Zn/Cd efflux system component
MARASKATGADIGTGTALPDPALTTFKAFIVASSAAPLLEPDGLYHLRLGNWVRDAGAGGAVEIGTGTALPDPLTSPYAAFIVASSAAPLLEPDGFYYLLAGSWVRP